MTKAERERIGLRGMGLLGLAGLVLGVGQNFGNHWTWLASRVVGFPIMAWGAVVFSRYLYPNRGLKRADDA